MQLLQGLLFNLEVILEVVTPRVVVGNENISNEVVTLGVVSNPNNNGSNHVSAVTNLYSNGSNQFVFPRVVVLKPFLKVSGALNLLKYCTTLLTK